MQNQYNRKHFFHLVDASPWPLLVSMVMLVVALILALSFHYDDAWLFWDILNYSDASLKAQLYKSDLALYRAINEFTFLAADDLRCSELSQWVELYNFLYYNMGLSVEASFDVIYKLFYDKFGSNVADKLINYLYYAVHIKNTNFYDLFPLIWLKYLGEMYLSFFFHWRFRLTLFLSWYFYDLFFFYWIIFFVLLFSPLYFWLRDVIIEGTFLGHHTKNVKNLLRQGFLLFIVSEVMFFFSFFWAFFHSSFSPAFQIGGLWPPSTIVTPYCWDLPLSNTILLLVSGAWVTAAHHMLLDSHNLHRKDDDFYVWLLNKGFFGKIFAFLRHSFSIRYLYSPLRKLLLMICFKHRLFIKADLVYTVLLRRFLVEIYENDDDDGVRLMNDRFNEEEGLEMSSDWSFQYARINFREIIVNDLMSDCYEITHSKWRLPPAFHTTWRPIYEHINWFYWTKFWIFRRLLNYRTRKARLFSYLSKMIKDTSVLYRLPLMLTYYVILRPNIVTTGKIFKYDDNLKLIMPRLPTRREDLADLENTHNTNSILLNFPSYYSFNFRSLWLKVFYLLYNRTQVFNFHHLLGFYNARVTLLDMYAEYFWIASYTFSAYYWKIFWRWIKILLARVFYFVHVFLFRNKSKDFMDYLLDDVFNEAFVEYWTKKFLVLDKRGGLVQLFWRLNFFYEFPYRSGFEEEEAHKLASSMRYWLCEQIMDFYYLASGYKDSSLYYSAYYFSSYSNPALSKRYEWGRNEGFYEYDIKALSLQKKMEVKNYQIKCEPEVSSKDKIKNYAYNYNQIWKNYNLYTIKKFLDVFKYIYKKTILFASGDLVFMTRAYETFILPRPTRLDITDLEATRWGWLKVKAQLFDFLLNNRFFYSIETMVIDYYEKYFFDTNYRTFLWNSSFFLGLSLKDSSNFTKDSVSSASYLLTSLDIASNEFSEFNVIRLKEDVNINIYNFLNEKGLVLATHCLTKLSLFRYEIRDNAPLQENSKDPLIYPDAGEIDAYHKYDSKQMYTYPKPYDFLKKPDLLENTIDAQLFPIDLTSGVPLFPFDAAAHDAHIIRKGYKYFSNLVFIQRLYAVALRTIKKDMVNVFLTCTLVCGIAFLFCQIVEYYENLFDITDSVYGSTFYIMTGFHGLHVLAGMIFLIVVKWRNLLGHFTKRHHVGFTLAIWYWHFVDIVWVLLFLVVYIWGS